MCLVPLLYQFTTYKTDLIILIRTSGACGSTNLSTVTQSPITWLGHARSVKIQLFPLSYSRVLNSFVCRIPGVNSGQKFITGQMLLFISIRRLETVQRNSLSMKYRNEETRREQFVKSVNKWGFHSDKREYCTNCMEYVQHTNEFESPSSAV